MLFQQQFLMSPTHAAPIVYRSKSSGTSSALALTKPAGVAVGDIAVILQPTRGGGQGVATASGATWTTVAFTDGTFNWSFSWKLLNSTDVANGWAYNSADRDFDIVAFQGNGATTVSLKETRVNTTGAAGLAYTGFNPDAAHRGAVAMMLDQNSAVTPTQPTNWSLRDSTALSSGPTVRCSIADSLGAYQGGALSWTGLSGASEQLGILLEIT